MLVSRQILPSRNIYRSASGPPAEAIGRLEMLGATVNAIFSWVFGLKDPRGKCERRMLMTV